jgi:3-deoxy-manno-octulosonate cytidylyltransferase (CMP-KDO synthetase)
VNAPAATVVIPARLESSRLPNKVLADIAGKTMLRRTHEVAQQADCGPVLVLADAEEVAEEVRSFGGEVMLTSPELDSGTARIASVVEELQTEIVVNLQGDAPLTDPAVVAGTAAAATDSGAPLTMPVYPMTQAEDVADPSVVKVVRAHDGRALYCSRSPVPHVRGVPAEAWPERGSFWGHVGLYAYTRDFLRSFEKLPMSPLEQSERLEQLRWLEAGLRLHTFEVEPQGPSVDTPAQLDRVRAAFLERDRRPGA